ncbi:Glucan endo-1,3-beta-glucosidase BGN13.1 [Hirsutella minnesotensis 3608]|nr:Glucan endo-1,3-beta-glucosidase BGN13.1 [Hirsutella minnesotensis 3608]
MLRLAAIAALVLGLASADPNVGANSTSDVVKRATSFWYPHMDHVGKFRGYAPDLDGDYAYQVFKAVKPGDGDAIQIAINENHGGKRHGRWFASQPRVVYIPPGTYEIKKTIYMNTDTILMGDPTNPPILKAAAGFPGEQILLSGHDPTTGEKGEESFAVGLKNLVLDTTSIPGGKEFTALYWGVAQAAQLQNIKITMAYSKNGKGHSGIRLGRGSTLGLSDVRVERGLNGIWHDGHQQAAYKNIHFYKNTNGMLISAGDTITIMGSTFETCDAGVRNTGGSPWIALIDCASINSGVTFITTGSPSFLIENLVKNTDSDVAQTSSGTVLRGHRHVDSFTFANTVGRKPAYGPTTSVNRRPAVLAPGGKYPVIPAPNYHDKSASDVLNVKDPSQNGGHTVFGDNSRDESNVLNRILRLAAKQGKIAYFPFGKYRVDSTLLIPPGTRIVGEAWATISGCGNYFKNEKHPKPVVAVGRPGDVGVAQIQDMRFTVSEVLPGAIIVQFNMAGRAPGDVALWNSLVTVGGTRGAPALTNGCRDANNPCKAAFIGIHLAKTSSAYIDNVWNWVADHIAEDFAGGSSIAGKGGVLVESRKATWLHALGSEHWWLYQLNLRQADNVMVSLLQAETNYEQGDNARLLVPAPWRPDARGWGDPDFSWCAAQDKRCRMGFANYINGGSGIYTYASAAWAFFSGPGYQGCNQFQCQRKSNP